MPICRNDPFHRKPRQTGQKPEERKTFRRKFAPHLPALWLFGALLWCGFIKERLFFGDGLIFALSLYFGFTSLMGFFVRCLAPPRVRDIPDLVLIVATILIIFWPGGEFFGWNWLFSALLLAVMALENIVRAIRGKERRRAVWKVVFASMTLISLFFLNYIAAAWASC